MGKRKENEKKKGQSPPPYPDQTHSQQKSVIPLGSDTLTEEAKEGNFYSALGHDIRRQILRLIGSGENIGFSLIKKKTQMSTGTIYHHLEVLSDFISQDQKKKYILTDLGEKAYIFLTQDKTSLVPTPSLLPPKIREIIFLTPLSNFFSTTPKWGKIFALGLVSLIGLFCVLFDIPAYLFYFSSQTMPARPFNANNWLVQIGSFLSVLGGLGVIMLIVEILVRFLYQRNFSGAKLLNLMGIPYLPILCYVSLIAGIKSLSSLPPWLTILINILFIGLQIWTIVLLASIISIVKEINFERGLLIAIFINYGTFLILLITNTPIFA